MIKKKQKNSKELLFENMAKLNPDFIYLDSTNLKKLVNESEDKWIQKAVNPEHKGFCSPESKPTCTPKRKALAKRFKRGIEDESYGTPAPLGKSMAKPINEEGLNEIVSSSPIGKFVMFGYNYPPDFIEQVWADDPNMMKHLKEKFGYFYNKVGPDAVMNRFFVELDDSNQRKLEDWITANYKG